MSSRTIISNKLFQLVTITTLLGGSSSLMSGCHSDPQTLNLRSQKSERVVSVNLDVGYGRERRDGLSLVEPMTATELKLRIKGGNFVSELMTISLDGSGSAIFNFTTTEPAVVGVIESITFQVGTSAPFELTAENLVASGWTQNGRIGFSDSSKRFVAIVTEQIGQIGAGSAQFKVRFLETAFESSVASNAPQATPTPQPSGAPTSTPNAPVNGNVQVSLKRSLPISVTSSTYANGVVTANIKCNEALDGGGANVNNVICGDYYLYGSEDIGHVVAAVVGSSYDVVTDSNSRHACMLQNKTDLWIDNEVGTCNDGGMTFITKSPGLAVNGEASFVLEVRNVSPMQGSINLLFAARVDSNGPIDRDSSALTILKINLPAVP